MIVYKPIQADTYKLMGHVGNMCEKKCKTTNSPASDDGLAALANFAELPLEFFSVSVGHDGVERRAVHDQAGGAVGVPLRVVGEVGVRLVDRQSHVLVGGRADVEDFVGVREQPARLADAQRGLLLVPRQHPRDDSRLAHLLYRRNNVLLQEILDSSRSDL